MEHAGDATELERSTKECGAHRSAFLIEVANARIAALVANRLQLRAANGERRRENGAEAHSTLRSAPAFDEYAEHIVRLQIPTHVHTILVDVGECPRELGAIRRGEVTLCRVEGVVKRRGDRPAKRDGVGHPGKRFLRTDPARVRSAHRKDVVDGELENELGGNRV